MPKWTYSITIVNNMDRALELVSSSVPWGKCGKGFPKEIAAGDTGEFNVYSSAGKSSGIEFYFSMRDKVEKAGFHTEKAEFVDAPVILELPMAVECRLVSYDKEDCRLVGEIVNVSADETILDENGKIDPAKLEPIVFDPVNHVYLKLGEKAGNAFKDGMKLK